MCFSLIYLILQRSRNIFTGSKIYYLEKSEIQFIKLRILNLVVIFQYCTVFSVLM